MNKYNVQPTAVAFVNAVLTDTRISVRAHHHGCEFGVTCMLGKVDISVLVVRHAPSFIGLNSSKAWLQF